MLLRPLMWLLLWVSLAVCLVAAIVDLLRGAIPNALTYPLLIAAPLLHFGLSLAHRPALGAAFGAAGLSVAGLVLCGAVPLFMWWKGALGGGDVKLFGVMGALLGPSVGFEAELYVFVTAALIAPAKLVYDGTLGRSLLNVGTLLLNVVRKEHRRTAVEPALVSWFRLGPCFALGCALELALHWGGQ